MSKNKKKFLKVLSYILLVLVLWWVILIFKILNNIVLAFIETKTWINDTRVLIKEEYK